MSVENPTIPDVVEDNGVATIFLTLPTGKTRAYKLSDEVLEQARSLIKVSMDERAILARTFREQARIFTAHDTIRRIEMLPREFFTAMVMKLTVQAVVLGERFNAERIAVLEKASQVEPHLITALPTNTSLPQSTTLVA